MKKKGKSNDEKKSIIYDVMLQSETFFILKELESLGQKNGVRSILVKDLVQQLVDDNAIKSEKVGAQNIFWVLKTEESSILQNRYEKLKEKKEAIENMKRKEEEEYDSIMNNLKYSQDELQIKHEEAVALQEKLNGYLLELENLKKTDVKEIQKLEAQSDFAKESIDRWTNNIYIVKQWVENRTNYPSEIVDKLLGVKDIFGNWN